MLSNTALIVIDFQNEFVRAEGKLHSEVKDLMEETGMLQKIPHVLRAGRDSGAVVIHSPVVMEAGGKFKDEEWDPHAYGSMENLFVKGTWNCEFAAEVPPEDSDIILQNRTNFSAFRGTQLKNIIEEKEIKQIFIMGFLSNACVEETTREAREIFPELNIYVLLDGCAAKSKQDHYVAMGLTLPQFANVISCSDAQGLLRMSAPSSRNLRLEEDTNETQNLIQRPVPVTAHRPRILALHGARSNNEVTKLQLENLDITPKDYDIVYLHGKVETEVHPDLEGLFSGPFYSWFDPENKDKYGPSIIAAVKDVSDTVDRYGPFDGVYGFSQGAAIASLVSNLTRDTSLQEHVEKGHKRKNLSRGMSRGVSKRNDFKSTRNDFKSTRNGLKSMRNNFKSTRDGLKSMRNFGTEDLTARRSTEPLFKFAILACAAPDISSLSDVANIGEKIEPGTIPVSSFHLIGLEDALKGTSEKNALLFANRAIYYMSGGHSVTRDGNATELTNNLKKFAQALGRPPRKDKFLHYTQMSEASSVHLLTEHQVALVKLNHEALPEGLFEGGATIRGALKAQPKEKPFLYTSRNTDAGAFTSYGDVLDFIDGGKGDLRALGVAPGEVVAYGAPPGGSPVAGLAFLSIGAQTTAAPLAPGTAKPDTLDALDQFNAKHLILFEGVDCPGVEAAFNQYASTGKAKIHIASFAGNGRKPGMYEYKVDYNNKNFDGKAPLVNKESGTCLLLRTSGTTARPKGVPLSQGSLITNGALIAKSMSLTESDVCYSVMPLFHIGGISASILCTMTSGGAVSCDDEPYDPGRMVDALAISRPQPTWYSSVPTIHNATVSFLENVAASDPKYNAYGIDSNGIWLKGHSLRMIRSGAAALLGPDGKALAAAYGGVPIYPTYSMSEQMPISQPPAEKGDTLTTKPGSVGVPVAASTAIVSKANLRPQPQGVEGEIAISGYTVMKNYLSNPEADQKNFFYLTLAEDYQSTAPYFLTGDVGVIDSDGFLSLKGRAKELIKKGGEQVSPYEVEEPLLSHPWVQTPICFSVPSKLYGEEVGCALVLSSKCPVNKEDSNALRQVSAEMRLWLKGAELAAIKWPTKWILVNDDQLIKTKTKKYIRIGLSTHLGMDPTEEAMKVEKKETKAKLDWKVIGSFRFILACYVMFMHIGSNKSWGAFNNLRGWPWHVHVFFTLGGYSMASPMNPTIQKKFSYFLARIWSMYPMYAVALIFGLINLLIVCRPSTFRSEFHWDAQPDDLYLEDGSLAPLFCEGTPATPTSYWGSLILTILVYIFGLAVTPFWPLNWWLGYYLWFSSMYYCCLACFPVTYNYFFDKTRKNAMLLIKIIIGLFVLNAVIIVIAWFSLKDLQGYGHYDSNGKSVPTSEYTNGSGQNIGILSFYLFGPFWQIYFVVGVCTAFLYDAYRPAERHNARNWGWVADAITLLMLGFSIAIINQGVQPYEEYPEEKYMRPDEADQFTDSANSNRIWDNLCGRLWAPITTLWIFSLSTGEGFTAMLLRNRTLSDNLAPNAYNCFLFHQMIGQWYYAATRNGTMWNWWRFRKTMYWFSPGPCPVEWYEYFYVISLVVLFSKLMTALEPLVSNGLDTLKGLIFTVEENDEEDTGKVLCGIIEGMTGIEPMMDFTLEECGLASIGVPVLVTLLNKNFSTKKNKVNITAADLVTAKTIDDIGEVVDAAKALERDQGV